jgi:hypothetical protein
MVLPGLVKSAMNLLSRHDKSDNMAVNTWKVKPAATLHHAGELIEQGCQTLLGGSKTVLCYLKRSRMVNALTNKVPSSGGTCTQSGPQPEQTCPHIIRSHAMQAPLKACQSAPSRLTHAPAHPGRQCAPLDLAGLWCLTLLASLEQRW